jgi:L-threonylcarbamoyladenylate synthase
MNPKAPGTIGLRVPNHAIAQMILRRTGPLATTSVNISGQPPLQTMAEIEQHFPQVLTLNPQELTNLPDLNSSNAAILGGSGTPSTVAQWTGHQWKILRQGSVVLDE